jgi:hypothetical protein
LRRSPLLAKPESGAYFVRDFLLQDIPRWLDAVVPHELQSTQRGMTRRELKHDLQRNAGPPID